MSSIGRPANTAGAMSPPTPLAVSATTRSGAERVEVDERVDVGDERGQEIATLGPTGILGALEQPAGDHRLDLGQAGVLPDGERARPAQLHAVVLGRVVAGGEHRRRRVEAAGGEVAEVGGGQAEVDDVGARHQRALGEGGDQRFGRRPGVAADEHAGRPGEGHEGVADAPGDRLVELVGIDPANVIGLEDGVERRVGHRSLGSSPRERDGNRTLRRRSTPHRNRRASPCGQAPPHQAAEAGETHQREHPARPVGGRRCAKVSFTCLLVGTTTMKLGVARHGPSAPSTSQFG